MLRSGLDRANTPSLDAVHCETVINLAVTAIMMEMQASAHDAVNALVQVLGIPEDGAPAEANDDSEGDSGDGAGCPGDLQCEELFKFAFVSCAKAHLSGDWQSSKVKAIDTAAISMMNMETVPSVAVMDVIKALLPHYPEYRARVVDGTIGTWRESVVVPLISTAGNAERVLSPEQAKAVISGLLQAESSWAIDSEKFICSPISHAVVQLVRRVQTSLPPTLRRLDSLHAITADVVAT
jgi:hypothetical protein